MNPCNMFSQFSSYLHVYILRFVAAESDLCNVKMVNRHWHQYGEANDLWESLAPPVASSSATMQSSVVGLLGTPILATTSSVGDSESSSAVQLPYISIRSRAQLAKLWCDERDRNTAM